MRPASTAPAVRPRKRRRAPGASARGSDQLGRPRERRGAEHGERRVGGQQPAPEVARLDAQVDEQRQRHRHEHQPAHETAPQLERGAGQRGDRGGPAETPGEAVEVVGDAARLLARLRLVRGHLGLVAKVAPPGVERAEQVGVEHHEHEPGEAAPRAPGRRARRARSARRRASAAIASGSERQPRRVLERQREPGGGAGQREVAQAPVLVRPTEKQSASATPSSAPTSVTATREYATGRNAKASSAAATSPSRTPQSRRAAQ